MTKYILNSGGIKNAPDLKKKFHLEMIEGIQDMPKIVLCNFAQAREFWEVKFPGYCSAIQEDMPDGISAQFDLAHPDKFEEQCRWADIIYFHGGDDSLVQYWVKKFDYRELFKDKVVVTNSASSNMLAAHYWTCDWRACDDGLAVLPIKFMSHYDSRFGEDDPRGPVDWQTAYDELVAYGDTTLPIYALKEGEFVVFEKEDT